jgi:flagellar biosynthesis/type III secretory pathway chaperone
VSIPHIVQCLEQLNTIHLELLSLGENKKQVIIDNNVDELNKIVSRESKLMKQIVESEQKRMNAIHDYLQQQGHSSSSAALSISELIKLVFKADEKKALIDAQSALLETLVKLKKMNDINQQLIGQSLQYINFSLDIIAPSENEATYHKPNQQKGYQKPGMFDTRA